MDSFETYIVKAGDNLWRIAKTFFLDITDIMKANHLTGPSLAIGQELKIPVKTASEPVVVTPAEPASEESSVTDVTESSTPVVEPAPTAESAPVADTAPVADATPVADTAPVVDATPAVDATPVVEPATVSESVTPTTVVEPKANVTFSRVPIHSPSLTYPLNTATPVITDPVDPSKIVQLAKYTVVKGDNLSVIAASHHVTLDELIAANPQITSPNLIYPGQVINIPAPNPGLVTVYDSVDWRLIPRDAKGVAYYIDGAKHYDAGIDLSLFPDLIESYVFTITTTGGSAAKIIDCETGDVEIPGLASALSVSGADWIYIDKYQWQRYFSTLQELRTNKGVVPKWWIADWTNVPHLVPGSDATQWTSETNYDVSLFALG